MKVSLYYLPSSSMAAIDSELKAYADKISRFVPFELKTLKARKIGDDRADEKARIESELLLEAAKKHRRTILFDERGVLAKDSRKFSESLVKQLSHNDVAFFVGGAFGVMDLAKREFSDCWSLGPLTMHHQLACVVAAEQIYRGLTIWKNHPYHND